MILTMNYDNHKSHNNNGNDNDIDIDNDNCYLCYSPWRWGVPFRVLDVSHETPDGFVISKKPNERTTHFPHPRFQVFGGQHLLTSFSSDNSEADYQDNFGQGPRGRGLPDGEAPQGEAGEDGAVSAARIGVGPTARLARARLRQRLPWRLPRRPGARPGRGTKSVSRAARAARGPGAAGGAPARNGAATRSEHAAEVWPMGRDVHSYGLRQGGQTWRAARGTALTTLRRFPSLGPRRI